MANSHLVVDGSNIATEGRTAPSLAQLDEAVRDFTKEHHFDNVVVVVDATFAHRIDPEEREIYEEAAINGELLTPPAGAVGRGDAFVLQIAERSGATILSNDSFQEFHATYDWLFSDGRLWGGKPVPGVGWVFVARVPVRGPVSRRATRDAKRDEAERSDTKDSPAKGRSAKDDASSPATSTARRTSTRTDDGGRRGATSAKAAASRESDTTAPASRARKKPATAVASADAPKGSAQEKQPRNSSRGRAKASQQPINTPNNFLTFVTSFQLGSTVDATVIEFSSHGAYVDVDGARCYVSLKSMGEPAPRSAREVLAMGEVRPFIVQGFDTPRRGIDLALLGFEHFEADPSSPPSPLTDPSATGSGGDGTTQSLVSKEPAEEAQVVAKKAPAKKAPAKKAPAKKAPARKAPAKKAPAKKAPARKAPAKKAPARKAPAKKAPAKKAPAKKAPARKAVAKKAPAKKAPARKAVAKKR